MALSYYSNWGTQLLDQHPKQDQTTTITTSNSNSNSFLFPQQQLSQDLLLPPELLNFYDNFDTCIDKFFSQVENADAYTALSPSPVSLNSLPPLPSQEMDACFNLYPKHMKIQENYFFYPEMTIHDNYDDNIYPEFVLPELSLPMPLVFNEGTGSNNNNNVKKPANAAGAGSLSQQSIAARIRRRKITEKTQELGKLIPGGQKMNTAEMFQAASKYIKFMQAQVGVLQLMQEENEEGMHSPELEALLTSPVVQEKLYSAEKCLVPKIFVKTLTQKPQLPSDCSSKNVLIKLLI